MNSNQIKRTLIFDKNNKASNPRFIDGNFFCNLTSLKLLIKKLNNKKSSGIDKIPNIAIKKLPDNTITNLATLFNNMLNNAHFPAFWKMAKVVPIPKKRKTHMKWKVIDR